MIKKLKEYRCYNCDKLLLKGIISKAVIEIKCRNCKTINQLEEKDCLDCRPS